MNADPTFMRKVAAFSDLPQEELVASGVLSSIVTTRLNRGYPYIVP